MARSAEELKRLSIKEFTEAAKVYESGHAGIYEMCKDDYPQMLEELELEPFEDALDVGCGTGAVLELLHARYPSKRLTGLDLTPGMIDVARASSSITSALSSETRRHCPSSPRASTPCSAPTASTTTRIRRGFSPRWRASFGPAGDWSFATTPRTMSRSGS